MRTLFLIVCFFIAELGFSAPNPPQPQPLDGPPPPGDSIDGIVVWLIVLAILFGYYKFKSIQKPQNV